MPDPQKADVQTRDAGEFGTWLDETLAAQRGAEAPEVPCGTCTACCTSSQFIHIGAEESRSLKVIDDALLFPAPGAPDGTKLMGYDERGHCPQLSDEGCKIYSARPRTCRQYDCRIFAAANLTLTNAAVSDIARRVSQWTFSHASEDAKVRHDAVKAAAAFIRDKPEAFERPVPPSEILQAQVAVRVHELFLPGRKALSDAALASEILYENQAFTGA